MERLKIILACGIFPPDIGGPATYAEFLAKELSKYNLKIIVITYSDEISKKNQPIYEFPVIRIWRRYPKLIRYFLYGWNLVRIVYKSDLIYAQGPVSEGLPALIVSKILRKRFILKITGSYAWEQYLNRVSDFKFEGIEEFQKKREYSFKIKVLRWIERWVAKRAEIIITPSEYLKKIVSCWGIPFDKIRVIYNAFDPPELKISKEEVRKQLNLSGTVLISIGRLVPWKGFSVLIEIMPKILKEIPDAKLIIIGNGPQDRMLKLQITNYKLQNNVIMRGRLPHEDSLLYLYAGDIFILNTAYEGFSHQLLEAMAMKTPIITTNAGGNSELVKNEINALVVPYNNSQAIIDAIIKLKKNPELAKKLTIEAQERARNFSPKKMLNEFFNLINSL